MKKKIGYMILFGCLLFSSCIVDEYPKPPKTSMAKNVVDEASYSLVKGIKYSDIIIKANTWLSESNVAEKNNIEDLYFPMHKLRMSGDTIIILNLCKIMSFGKKLEQMADKWILMDWFEQDTAFFSKLAENKYSISLSHKLYSFDLGITSTKKGYLVSGSGKHMLWEQKAIYQISTEIDVADITPTIYTDQDEMRRHFIGGINQFKWYRDSRANSIPVEIKVEFTSYNSFNITAFGFTDNYTGY